MLLLISFLKKKAFGQDEAFRNLKVFFFIGLLQLVCKIDIENEILINFGIAVLFVDVVFPEEVVGVLVSAVH